MNILKKAFTKDDIKRYQKKSSNNDQTGHISKLNQNSISNRNNWTDINQLIQCRGTYQKSVQSLVTQKVKSLIKKSFESGELTVSSDILIKSLLSIVQQYYHEQEFDYSRLNLNHNEQKIVNLLQLLEKILKEDEKQQAKLKSLNSIDDLKKCIELTKKYLDDEFMTRKNKQLSEYEKIISVLKPTKKKQERKEQKRQNIQKMNKKLLSSLSSGNLYIKVTTQQISIQKEGRKPNEQINMERKKSQGNLFKVQSESKLKNHKNQGHIKLENFLKDPNIKITKTTVEYDYNAILEGSKSNLQFRNKTMQPDSNMKPQKDEGSVKNYFEITNINKAKKDQGFVFYRPKPSKNQNKQK